MEKNWGDTPSATLRIFAHKPLMNNLNTNNKQTKFRILLFIYMHIDNSLLFILCNGDVKF